MKRFRERAGIDSDQYLAWCESRVALFRRYTLPSVLRQEYKRFEWLIWFDTEINPPIADLLHELERYPCITPVYLDNRPGARSGGFVASVKREVARRVPERTSYVFTSRLDTDDALNKGFLASVNGFLRRTLPEEVSRPLRFEFPVGAQMAEDVFRLYTYQRNPFACVVEKMPAEGEELLTAFGFSHTQADPPTQPVLTSQPQWLQIIHGGNVANSVNHALLPFAEPRQMAELFGIDPD